MRKIDKCMINIVGDLKPMFKKWIVGMMISLITFMSFGIITSYSPIQNQNMNNIQARKKAHIKKHKRASHKYWKYHSKKWCKKHHVKWHSKKAIKNHKKALKLIDKNKTKKSNQQFNLPDGVTVLGGTPINNSAEYTTMNWKALPTPNAKVNIQISDSTYKKAVEQAIKNWNNTGIVNIQQVNYQGKNVKTINTINDSKKEWLGEENNNGGHLIEKLGNNVLPCIIEDGGTITLNMAQINAHCPDIYSGVLENAEHEIGHYLGLGHNWNTNSIMYPFGNLNNIKIGLCDVNALARYYGEPLLTQSQLDQIQANE